MSPRCTLHFLLLSLPAWEKLAEKERTTGKNSEKREAGKRAYKWQHSGMEKRDKEEASNQHQQLNSKKVEKERKRSPKTTRIVSGLGSKDFFFSLSCLFDC